MEACSPGGEKRVPARSLRQFEQPGCDLVDGVLADADAAGRAKGLADTGEEQPQEIVAFGGGGDGRARITGGVLLPDRDGGSDAVDVVHVRLLHPLEKLARVSGERFDIAALALGVDRVEGERRLPRPRDARDDGQLIVGNRKRNVFEVVDPRAADPDVILHAVLLV